VQSYRVHTTEIGGNPDYFQEITSTNLFVQYAFSGLLSTITIVNDSSTDQVELSFDGATLQGSVKPGESLVLHVDQKSSVWLRGTVGGDMIRLFGWASSVTASSIAEFFPLPTISERSAIAVNDAVLVGVTSTTIVAANSDRLSIIVVNDSTSILYVFKGSPAEMNKGIRLNAGGGAIVVFDYTGIITAISPIPAQNLTYSEVSF
jgi:hypothetical protein